MNQEIPVYNLWTDEYYIELKPGEEICPKCNGTGVFGRNQYGYKLCYFCFGTGKVDWIKRIRGEQ